MNNKKSFKKSLGLGLSIAIGIFIFAYAFQVTDVDFGTTRDEVRQTSLTRVLRALAHPDLVEYETSELNVEIPFYLPCPEGETPSLPDNASNEPYITATAACAGPGEMLTVEGFNFPAYVQGPLNFITSSGVKKQLEKFQADADGYFIYEIEVPKRQPVAEAQAIRATVRTNIGGPMWSKNAIATWDKIIETIFIALLATTIGTLIAIPTSFIAARNLMVDNTSPLTSVAFSVIGWLIGIWIGSQTTQWLLTLFEPIADNLALNLAGTFVSFAILYAVLRWSIGTDEDEKASLAKRVTSTIGLAVFGIAFAIFFSISFRAIGTLITEPLGSFGFFGNFIFQLGEIMVMLTPALIAIFFGAFVGSSLSKIGQRISDYMPAAQVKLINILLASIAGAALFALFGAGVEWFYQIANPVKTLYIPAGVGAALGLILAITTTAKSPLPTGLIIYTITRTILNGTRSVEPLVMAIIAVIWVGIGPFAGSLALALHTVAALAKLYSEQVESISAGPIEAVQATGANQLQTIVYAVVPQIIPPYISFTMYRWDINVRMSTIIGFVGGGGIGFLLSQNINLLDYRAASAQMLAIAVVVASMDYISSVIREKFV
jgi:phosphonate ABC transporter permease subunit PhnE